MQPFCPTGSSSSQCKSCLRLAVQEVLVVLLLLPWVLLEAALEPAFRMSASISSWQEIPRVSVRCWQTRQGETCRGSPGY